MRKGIISRDLTKSECPWLEEGVVAGAIVYEFHGPTYGNISQSGVAVSSKAGENPYFEVPRDAVEFDK